MVNGSGAQYRQATGPRSETRTAVHVPGVVIVLLAVLGAIHGGRTLLLSDDQDIEFLLTFAFIPARYDTSVVLGGALPGGFGAEIWTFVTYALIHANWMHFIVNSIWMLPFGSALARRFGTMRFLAFFAVTAAAGAAMHLATNAGCTISDDRRLGRAVGHDGRGDAFCISARRAARHVARRR
ncbi:MAG: rhomboid family intramembrane serine protease [Pseudolabrys sp.]